MCGICGVAGADPGRPPISGAALHAMTSVMAHRGPDEDGHLRSPGVALGMRRLSVIDLDASHQPITNESGSVVTVFNGEIYNYRELRPRLAQRGHRLGTAGDGETIVHLYEDHGAAFVKHLRGMFAIAIWDGSAQKLLLARDQLGVKPLYYAITPHGIAFASEVKCLLAGGLIEPSLDHAAAALFLALGFVPAPLTLFAGVRKLPPATLLEWHLGDLRGPTPYWRPDDPSPVSTSSPEADRRHLLALLRDAVRSQMVSDVPLGVMLSGGLDSSLIAALMAESSPNPIETFSVGFTEDANANELAWARRTAARLGSNHHELLTSASEHDELLEEGLWHLEEPVADLSFLGFMLLSRLARQHVTVALCGQAADELLGGYPKHLAGRITDVFGFLPDLALHVADAIASRADERSRAHRLVRAIATNDDLERYWAMSAVIPDQLGRKLRGHALGLQDPRTLLKRSFAAAQPRDPSRSRLLRASLLDLRLALPDLMFLYFDKMSMANSLEVRVPFADHYLVNFCMALPDDRRIRGFHGKEILRQVSSGLVDDEIIRRPKRGFFRSASSSWLAQNLPTVRETLLDPRCSERGLFDKHTLHSWLREPLGNQRTGEPLLTAFMLELWHRQFIDDDGIASRRSRDALDASLRQDATVL